MLLFYPFTFGIILGNFVNLLALIVLAATWHIIFKSRPAVKTQVMLGMLLAWATIKPQFIWLFLILVLMAGFKNRYWPLLISFCASLDVFFGISFVLLPNWPVLWLERVGKYVDYMGHYPNLTLYLNQLRTPEDAQTLTIALIALLLGVTAWALFTWWQGRLTSLVLLAWLGIVTYLINPRTVSYTQIAFLIPLLLWAQGQQNQRNLPVILFYWGSMIFSWAIFIASRLVNLGPLAEEWRLVVGSVWMFWLLISAPPRQDLPLAKSTPAF